MEYDLVLILALRDRIAALQAAPCRLAHERVIIEDSRAKRRSTGEETDLVRVGLCPAAFRSHQLSCAHTGAHGVLERALTAAAQAHVISREASEHMRAEVRRLAHAIHLTDAKKNDAELRYALLTEQQRAGEAAVVRAELDVLIGQHLALGEELGKLRTWFLSQLEKVIAQESKKPSR